MGTKEDARCTPDLKTTLDRRAGILSCTQRHSCCKAPTWSPNVPAPHLLIREPTKSQHFTDSWSSGGGSGQTKPINGQVTRKQIEIQGNLDLRRFYAWEIYERLPAHDVEASCVQLPYPTGPKYLNRWSIYGFYSRNDHYPLGYAVHS